MPTRVADASGPAPERSQRRGVGWRPQRGAAAKIGAHSCIQLSSAPSCLLPLRWRERPSPRQSAAERVRPQPSPSSARLALSCACATIAAGTICAAIVASPANLRAQRAPIGASIAIAVAAAGGIAANGGFTTDLDRHGLWAIRCDSARSADPSATIAAQVWPAGGDLFWPQGKRGHAVGDMEAFLRLHAQGL